MTSRTTTTAVLAIVCATAMVATATPYQETFDETYPLASGGRVALDNVNGDVTVEVWDRDEVRVYAIKEADDADLLDELIIDVDVRASTIVIDTEYPSSRGFSSRRHGRLEVEYTLTIPRSAELDGIDLVNGRLDVTGVEGGINADCVNGAIVVREARGDLELATVNGTIEADGTMLEAGTEVSLETVNGAIDLYLDGSVGAKLDVETVNGRLKNDFNVNVKKGKYVGASMNGSFGNAGVDVTIETVNGSVDVRQR